MDGGKHHQIKHDTFGHGKCCAQRKENKKDTGLFPLSKYTSFLIIDLGMLNFRNTNIFFTALLVVIAALNIFLHVPVFVYIFFLLFYAGILFYGSYFIQAGFYMTIPCFAKTS